MCGIVAYVGNKPVAPLLIEGLKRLEYRGYDSAGIAVMAPNKEGGGDSGGDISGSLTVSRSVGRVSVLEAKLREDPNAFAGALGIAHTRWATHGEPSEPNAHPHTGTTRSGHRIAVVHNGIIENYASLRKYLEGKGHSFYSQTDTEVLAKLIAELYEPPEAAIATGKKAPGGGKDRTRGLEAAVQSALREVTGAYAICVVCEAEPHTLVAARKGSPLIIGVADNSYVVASDASAIISHTTQVITLDDYQVARLCAGPADSLDKEGGPWAAPFRTTTIDNQPVTSKITELELDLQQIELGDYEHYMLKEIMEQPEALRTCMSGRIDLRESRVVLGGLANYARDLVRAKRFILTGQGTAYHAGLIGEYLFEDLAKVPTRCQYASEFRYQKSYHRGRQRHHRHQPERRNRRYVGCIKRSQGARGVSQLGAVNAVGSTISRETDAGVYLHVGPEIGVASTKAFVGQVMVLTLMSLYVGKRKYLSNEVVRSYIEELNKIPRNTSRACCNRATTSATV